MKINIKLEGYLKYKYHFDSLELHYANPATVGQILAETKISSADVFFIKVGNLLVKEDYLLTQSTEVKLFPVIGGG